MTARRALRVHRRIGWLRMPIGCGVFFQPPGRAL
jgi:hypothetical protein